MDRGSIQSASKYFFFFFPRQTHDTNQKRFETGSIWHVRSFLERLGGTINAINQSMSDSAPSGRADYQAWVEKAAPLQALPWCCCATTPCSSLMLFLKLPIAEELNSPACVRVWERRGDYCSPSRKSSCAHKGKYLCRASAWQSSACLFFSPVFFFSLPRCSCFHNPSSPRPSAQRSSSSPTHSFFLYVFSKYSPSPLPPHTYKTLNSQQFL